MAEDMKIQEEKQRRGARSNQKLKILYLLKILLENTDAAHDITLQEIAEKLAANGVTAERKGLYDDIAQLNDFGIKKKSVCRLFTTIDKVELFSRRYSSLPKISVNKIGKGELNQIEKDVTMTNNTLNYYNQNANSFFTSTVSVNFTQTQDKFLRCLPTESYILDFGCGSGRDTKYFLEAGMKVDAIDGSEEMCRIASEYTGIKVQKMLFQELDAQEKYDGIWACASILHLPKSELKLVFKKMADAIKTSGIIYTSFKYGDFEGERNGRYFTDFTKESFKEFIQDLDYFQVKDGWITRDVRPGRGDERWLNLILQKN